MDVEREMAAVRRRVRAQIDRDARAALIRAGVDVDAEARAARAVERQRAADAAARLGRNMRRLQDILVRAVAAFSRGFAHLDGGPR